MTPICRFAIATPAAASFPTRYQYPILPGTPEWFELTDNQQKIDACVVPQEVLEAMTTEEVLETLLNYPLQNNIYAFNSIQAGVEVVYRGYSGEVLENLFTRPDRAEVILRRYQQNPIDGHSDDETFQNAKDQDTMEVLLQMKGIKELYSEAQLLEIEQAVTEKYLLRKESDFFTEDPRCEYFRIEMESAGGSPFFLIRQMPLRIARLSQFITEQGPSRGLVLAFSCRNWYTVGKQQGRVCR